MLAGLARVGIAVAWGPTYGAWHGPLLVVGLFVTLISLERALALGSPLALMVPALGAATGAALLLRLPAAPWLAACAAMGLVGINVAIVRRKAATFSVLTLVGSGVLLWGSLAWAMGRPLAAVVPAWMAFLVLTIVGERVRWSRGVATPRRATHVLVLLSVTFALASCAQTVGMGAAGAVAGATAVLLAAWQARYDVARHALGQAGAQHYVAVGVLAGVAWLAVAGVLLLLGPLPPAGPRYDAVLHAVLLGYVFSTVFAHAPTMLAAVAGFHVPFTKSLHIPMVLLHASLAARVAGDLADALVLRRIGSIGNALAMAVFVTVMSGAGLSARWRRSREPEGRLEDHGGAQRVNRVG